MGINGPHSNFIFSSSGYRSPLGTSMPSGSYAGNRQMWGSFAPRGSTSIDIRTYNYNTGGCYGDPYGMGGYYGGFYGGGCGCGGGGGISEKDALLAMGIGAGIGLLASPVGRPLIKGIGTGFKYLGMGIGWAGKQLWNGAKWAATKVIAPAANWTFNNILKPVGQGIGWCGKQIGNAFAYLGKGIANLFTGKNWSENNQWDKCGANK